VAHALEIHTCNGLNSIYFVLTCLGNDKCSFMVIAVPPDIVEIIDCCRLDQAWGMDVGNCVNTSFGTSDAIGLVSRADEGANVNQS
jgi:hypothetical protein